MSNLEELIERLCPDGVEYKTLGDVATISRGGNFQKKDFTEQGKPCIHYGQIYTRYGLFTDKTLTFINDECFAKQKYAEPNDIIMAVTSENIEDICKCIAWLGTEKVAVSGHSAIIHHSLDPKYLAYFFHSQHFFNQKRRLAHGTKVMEVTPDTLKSIQLPVPPLEVQREIVRILDNFTFLTAELAAELAARQKQYEYYRDLLLNFENVHKGGTTAYSIPGLAEMLHGLCPEGVEFLATKDIKTDSFWLMPTTPKFIDKGIKYITSKNIKNGIIDFENVKFISDNDYKIISVNRPIKSGDLLVTMIGTIGEAAFYNGEEPLYGQNLYLIRLNDGVINKKYYYYYLTMPKIKNSLISKKYASSQGYIKAGNLENLKLPVPPLEVQQRIVDILDRFDSLCNDISVGLPAEIEARQKQYEYYRDKLLTFKELKKEA